MIRPYKVVVMGKHSYCLSHGNTLATVIELNIYMYWCMSHLHPLHKLCIVDTTSLITPITALKWIFCCKHQNVFCRLITMTNVLQEIINTVYSFPKRTTWTIAVPYFLTYDYSNCIINSFRLHFWLRFSTCTICIIHYCCTYTSSWTYYKWVIYFKV